MNTQKQEGHEETGYMKITLTNLKAKNELPDGSYFLELNLADYRKDLIPINPKNNLCSINSFFVFECRAEDILSVHLKKEDKVTVAALCEFPIKKLVALPKIRHEMQIHMVDPSNIHKGAVATLEAQILYLENDIGTLELRIIEGRVFENASPSIGSYKLYLKIEMDNKKLLKTKSDSKGGSNPTWNQKVDISISSISKPLTIKLYDQGFAKKTNLGQVEVRLQKEDFLVPSKNKSLRTINIYNEDKIIGSIEVQSKFRLTPY